jgi:hypothetical protein
MGLSGNLRGKATRTAAKAKSVPNRPKSATATLGKTGFVKEFLNDHPQGNVRAVNEAWEAAGFEGTISPALVNKTRSLLGLTGNLRRKSKGTRTATGEKGSPTAKRRGRPPKQTVATIDGKPAGQPRGRKSGRTIALEGLEADIDRLLFKVMGLGDLPEIEERLRQARRLLYAGFDRT